MREVQLAGRTWREDEGEEEEAGRGSRRYRQLTQMLVRASPIGQVSPMPGSVFMTRIIIEI